MRTVKWVSETRILPGHGVAETGQELSLPDEVADIYVRQGEARELATKRTKETKGGEE